MLRMPLYAHARIEDPEDPARTWERGEEVSEADAKRLGLDPEFGAVSESDYDPEADKSAPPAYLEIDGVRYERQENPDAS